MAQTRSLLRSVIVLKESTFITLSQHYLRFLNSCSQKLFTTLILAETDETAELWHFEKDLNILAPFSPSTLERSDKLVMVYRVMGLANWSRKTAWSIWTAWRPVHTFSPWLKAEFCFWMALTCLWYLQITLCRLASDCSSAPSSMRYAI